MSREEFVLRSASALTLLALVLTVPAAHASPSAGAGEDPERRTVDAPEADAGACNCTHLIYFVPSDGRDDALDVNGAIGNSAKAVSTWFAAQMQMQPRWDRIGTSELYDITFVRGRGPGSSYADLTTVTNELAARGFDDPAKRYLVYAGLDRGTVCGESTFGGPVLPGPTYAVVYLDSPDCGARPLGGQGRGDGIAAHEWLHADGVVPPVATHHCPSSPHHVCTIALHMVASVTGIADPEAGDIMYPYVGTKLSMKVLDRDRDDYLDHGIPFAQDLRRSLFLEPA